MLTRLHNTIFTITLILCSSFIGVAQDSLSILPYTKKQASWFSFLEYKYETGAYEEVIKASDNYSKKAYGEPLYIPTRMRVLAALSYYSLLNLEKANTIINEAENAVNSCQLKEEAALAWLSMARFYEETGDFVKLGKVINRADSIGVLSKSSFTKLDLLWHQSVYYFNTGFYTKAQFLITQQESICLQNAMETAQDIKVRWYEDDNEELNYRRRRYAELMKLKAMCFVYKGQYESADSLIKIQNTWNNKNLSGNTKIKGAFYSVQGEMSTLRKSYNNSADYFISAYTVPGIREKETNKIYYLTNAIEHFFRSERQVESQSYLRRLQMMAYQSVGKKEDVQIAYEYAQAFSLYIAGNEKQAGKRLESVITDYKEIPDVNLLKLKTRIFLSEFYEKTGAVDKLLANEDTIASIRKKYYGSNSILYHQARLNQALLEIKYGKDFALASSIMRVSYDQVVSKQIDPNSPEHIRYLNAYAELYTKTDKLDSAAYLLAKAVQISKASYGDQSDQYLLQSALYADKLLEAGKYKEGLELLQTVMIASESIKIKEIETQQEIYLVLGKLYKVIGEYDRSRKILLKALDLDTRTKYNDFLLQAETSEQLASLYFQTDNFYRADRALNKSMSLKSKKLPGGNPLFYGINTAYAALKLSTGDLASVEQYIKSASYIAEDVYGKNSLIGVETSLLYGDFNYSIGDYKKAEEYYKQSDQLIIDKLGNKHLRHAEILLQLIAVRSKIPTYKKSDIEKLYIEALDVVKSAMGIANPLYMDIIQRQAEYFITISKIPEAEKNLAEAEKYWKAKLGNENQYLANIYELRGDIGYNTSKYNDAETQYYKAKEIYQKVFSENHKTYTNVYSKIAKVYYMNKNIDKSIAVMDDIIPKYLEFTVKYFPSMSFRQKQKYWNSIKDEFEFYNTLAFNSKKSSPELWAKAYNNTLATKAILLSSDMKLLNQVMSSEDTVLIELYNEWVGKKEYLLSVLSMSKTQLTEQGIDKDKIESEIGNLEKEMSIRSSVFSKDDRHKKLTTWEDIKQVLIQNEYAVEIIRYRIFNKVFTDSVYYGALIVKSSSSNPELILNNNGINMEKRNLKYYRNATVTHLQDEYSYDVYWKNIKAIIPDNALVYFSGDGVYTQLNLEMLRHDEGVYALDENQFVFVSNTKDLLYMKTVASKKAKESKKEYSTDFLFCGNPDFYSADFTHSERKVPDLPGTEKEIRLLNDLVIKSGQKTMAYYKVHITEDTLKGINNPKVIHIATHGYFAETVANADEDNLANSPLLNSGLMLYSSGDIVDNPENKYVNQKDGILTAYEAMNLVLDNTDLVVLSACETGRGELQVGEGVSGLQRSFLLAGSKAVIVSLFKVNDEVTQKLMLSFYEKWLKSGDKRKAFSDAKKEIKQQYPDPVYWGAFLMIEGKPTRYSVLKTN